MGNDTVLRPMLELSVIIPGAVLCYLPMKGHLNGKGRRIALWGIPALLLWAVAGGAACYRFRWDTNLWLVPSLALSALFTAGQSRCLTGKPSAYFWRSAGRFPL